MPQTVHNQSNAFLLKRYQHRLLEQLELRLPDSPTAVPTLRQAMRYASLNGGKRLRAALVYATGETFGAPLADLDAPACAVECIHAYSLIHDDLPAMDDDDLRRGQPSCHQAYGEAIAILAGDTLNTLAFEILADSKNTACNGTQRCRMIHCLAVASGETGMAGGQTLDILATGTQLSLQQLQAMHRLKTGALIQASVQLGALAANTVNVQDLAILGRFASSIGLAFQVVDDILDATASTATLGKNSGSDSLHNKITYVSLLGLQSAQQTANELYQFALECLDGLSDNTDRLSALANLMVHRSH
ncbi:MAG TPA: (2E,6E)-farnesyl diphosphate synthase [Gammaproteobacteria bacterium]|nr:(2E,6E)-farnesyl diphosphate synthase [Gammaproteobacteria bacterium]